MQTPGYSKTALALVSAAAGAAALMLVTGILVTASLQPASASTKWAQQTGKPCGFCHATPPALNAQGKKFQAKGHKL